MQYRAPHHLEPTRAHMVAATAYFFSTSSSICSSEPNPASVEALQKAVNHSAAKISFLWTSFIALAAYLLITTGSIKHRDLFLGTSIKLPILGVDPPVAGYFAAGPGGAP